MTPELEKRTRRGAIPFKERLATLDQRRTACHQKLAELDSEREAMIAREREKIDLLKAALPPEPKLGDSPDE